MLTRSTQKTELESRSSSLLDAEGFFVDHPRELLVFPVLNHGYLLLVPLSAGVLPTPALLVELGDALEAGLGPQVGGLANHPETPGGHVTGAPDVGDALLYPLEVGLKVAFRRMLLLDSLHLIWSL